MLRDGCVEVIALAHHRRRPGYWVWADLMISAMHFARGEHMRADVARRLKARGWKVGDTTEFLGLSEQEAVLVELRLALSRSVRERRLKLGLSQ